MTTSAVTWSQCRAWPSTSKPGNRRPSRGFPGGAAHFSRRRIAASSPIPPTMVTSSGASSGGPISML